MHEWARDPESRYGLYRIEDGLLVLVATTSLGGIGLTLTTLKAEGDLDGPVGVLDGIEDKWVQNPYERIRR